MTHNSIICHRLYTMLTDLLPKYTIILGLRRCIWKYVWLKIRYYKNCFKWFLDSLYKYDRTALINANAGINKGIEHLVSQKNENSSAKTYGGIIQIL